MLVAILAAVLPLVVDGCADWAGHGASQLADKLLERRHGGGGEVWSRNGNIYIEVGDCALEGLGVLLHPFCRAHQAFFLSVPTAEDNCAFGTPSLLEQSADAMHRFEHGRGAAVGIDGSVDPCVAVIADNDPVVRIFRAFHFANHVPDDASLVILLRDQVDLDSTRSFDLSKV